MTKKKVVKKKAKAVRLKKPTIVYEEFAAARTDDKYNFAELFATLETETDKWKKSKNDKPQPSLMFRKGVHYTIKTASMRHLIYQWKQKNDLPLSLRLEPTDEPEWIRVLWLVD